MKSMFVVSFLSECSAPAARNVHDTRERGSPGSLETLGVPGKSGVTSAGCGYRGEGLEEARDWRKKRGEDEIAFA